MKKLAYTTLLNPDPDLQQQYRAYHDDAWPEVIQSFRAIGVHDLNIWQSGNRLFMIAEVTDDFDHQAGLAAYLEQDPRCKEWESIMDGFQQAPPEAAPGEKWVALDHLFSF